MFPPHAQKSSTNFPCVQQVFSLFIPGWKADGNLPKLRLKTGAVVLFFSSSFTVPFGERRSLISCAATKRGRRKGGRPNIYLAIAVRRRRRRRRDGGGGEDRWEKRGRTEIKKPLTSFLPSFEEGAVVR